jgi:hypothetical protein
MRWILRLAFSVGLILLGSVPASAASDLQYVTGYTCPPYCGATADGTPAGPGVAACPPWQAFGTPVLIHFPDGDVAAICHDRGPDHVDLFWPTLAETYQHTGWFPIEVG